MRRPRPIPAAATLACGMLLVWGSALVPAPAGAAQADASAWRLALHSRQHSDATALNLGRDPQAADLAPRNGRNLAYVDDEARLERSQGAWTFGLLARSRATLVAGADTLALYRQVDSGAVLGADQRWAVDARLRGFSGAGVVFGRQHAWGERWSARWELQALVLQRWRERRLGGSVQGTAATGAYDFSLTSSQRDDRLRFPFQTDFASHGRALLGGVTLGWHSQRWQIEATLNDAGWQHWRALPRQDAVLDSRTAAVDADGFLIYKPLVQGQNGQPTATRTAPSWARVVVRRQGSAKASLDAEAGADVLPGFGALPWLGLRAPVGAGQLAVQWRTHERRLTLQWQWQGLMLTAGADRLGGAARSRELGLAWQLPI
jgi:hypothetical protein